MDPKGRHLLSCQSGAQLCTRHDELHDAMAGVLKDLGMRQVETEVSLPPTPKLEFPRSNIAFCDDDGVIAHLDLTVVAATSQQALQGGAHTKAGVAAEQSAQAKRAKYDPHEVLPLVIESGGRVGVEFSNFVKELLPEGFVRSQMAQTIWQTLSSTLQRANARAYLQARRAWKTPVQPVVPSRTA